VGEIKKCEVGMASNGIKFILNFMKDEQAAW
jgi:hypothetical protein